MIQSIQDLQHLTAEQSSLLAALEQDADFADYFFLTGGTLLKALNISPRYSNDLDFFTFPTVDFRQINTQLLHLKNRMEEVFGKESIALTDRGFIHAPSGMIVDIVADSSKNIDVFFEFGTLRGASLKDIAAHKASALCSREEIKDLVDIAFLTKQENWTLSDLAAFAQKKFQLGTITEEKLLTELLAKREVPIPESMFLHSGKELQRVAQEQVEHLVSTTTL